MSPVTTLPVAWGAGVTAFFTTRSGGVSRGPWDALNLGAHVGDSPASVMSNRGLVDAAAGARVRWANQVHGADVIAVTSGDLPAGLGPGGTAGALTAREPGVAVAVVVADCVPILLADVAAGVVAAVHAGRAGMAAGVVAAACGRLARDGATQLRAAVGPCVSVANYEVPAELRAQVTRVVPAAWGVTAAGTPALDLRAGVHSQLRDCGVAEIVDVEACTVSDERFYSHRRATAQGAGTTGRFAGVIVINP